MLVRMEQQVFDSLDHDELGRACLAPTIQQVRGRCPAVKSAVYAQLTEGQKALFMFRVMVDHARIQCMNFTAGSLNWSAPRQHGKKSSVA